MVENNIIFIKKCCKLIGLIPLAIIAMFFLKEEELQEHAKVQCIGLLLALFIFTLLYSMLIFGKIKKYKALFLTVFLWLIFKIIERKVIMKKSKNEI